LNRTRNESKTAKSIEKLIRACEDPDANVFPALFEAARARGTAGEMMEAVHIGDGASYDRFGQIEYPSWSYWSLCIRT